MGSCTSKKKMVDEDDVPYGAKDEKLRNEEFLCEDGSSINDHDKTRSVYVEESKKGSGLTVNIVGDNVNLTFSGIVEKNEDKHSSIQDITSAVVCKAPLTKVYTPSEESSEGQLVTGGSRYIGDKIETELNSKSTTVSDIPLCKEEKEIPDVTCHTFSFGNVQLTENAIEKNCKDDDSKFEDCKTHIETEVPCSMPSPPTRESSNSEMITSDSLEQDGSESLNLNSLIKDVGKTVPISTACSVVSSHGVIISRNLTPTNNVYDLAAYSIVSKRQESYSDQLSSSIANETEPKISSSEMFGSGHIQQPQLTTTSRANSMIMTTKASALTVKREPINDNHSMNIDDNVMSQEPGQKIQPTFQGGMLPSNENVFAGSNISVPKLTEMASSPLIRADEIKGDMTETKSIAIGEMGENASNLMTGAVSDNVSDGSTLINTTVDQVNRNLSVSVNSILSNARETIADDESNSDAEEDAEPAPQGTGGGEITNSVRNREEEKIKSNIDGMQCVQEIKDLGMDSMDKNFRIAMKGGDEVKIENGKEIGLTARDLSGCIKDIALGLGFQTHNVRC